MRGRLKSGARARTTFAILLQRRPRDRLSRSCFVLQRLLILPSYPTGRGGSQDGLFLYDLKHPVIPRDGQSYRVILQV